MDLVPLGNGIRFLGAGLAIGLAALGVGTGIGIATLGALLATARNPEHKSEYKSMMILGIVFAESVAIYALVATLILLFASKVV